ncbi:uncharacterized protein CLAFUR5_04026 [Fulvia fulva]|uniref:Uncharacterized protein n=1 Tax=Passalora fulva TaxID=5499 RepID=A0A9Q8LEB1_PASFU|nr:uncharacterized protein CLAFUR5_04026 [Fulvia fulva]UJO15877.1 hypothetical protein CLAFUR5_04026 [Fulvia fulva]
MNYQVPEDIVALVLEEFKLPTAEEIAERRQWSEESADQHTVEVKALLKTLASSALVSKALNRIVEPLLYSQSPGQSLADPRQFATALISRPGRAEGVAHLVIETHQRLLPTWAQKSSRHRRSGHHRRPPIAPARSTNDLYTAKLPQLIDIVRQALPIHGKTPSRAFNGPICRIITTHLHPDRCPEDALLSLLFIMCWNIKTLDIYCGEDFHQSLLCDTMLVAPLYHEAYHSLTSIHIRAEEMGRHHESHKVVPILAMHKTLALPNVTHLTATRVGARGHPMAFPPTIPNTTRPNDVPVAQWRKPCEKLHNITHVHFRACCEFDIVAMFSLLDACSGLERLEITPRLDIDYSDDPIWQMVLEHVSGRLQYCGHNRGMVSVEE